MHVDLTSSRASVLVLSTRVTESLCFLFFFLFFAFFFFQELLVIPWAITVTRGFQPKIATMTTTRENVLRDQWEDGGSTHA